MSVLVVDVGSSSVRAALVATDGSISAQATEPLLVDSSAPGVVEFDAAALAISARQVAETALASSGPVAAVGIAAQRASTILWDRRDGKPIAPAIGWQDLRTTGQCLALAGRGVRLAPNQSATKLAYLLDRFDPDRQRELCFGTVESFIAWTLSNGDLHISDATNAAVTGLVTADGLDWDDEVLEQLCIPRRYLPRLVDSTGVLGPASALPGTPPLAAVIGDQQASLVGQGCLRRGDAKATFGTGAMLDCVIGDRPDIAVRGAGGTFPVIAWRERGVDTWGLEAILLSAGSCVQWLRDGLGLVVEVAESAQLAASVRDGGGVTFVPALAGIGTPLWDFGARGTLVGLTAATSRAEIVYAVLEGIAHAGRDLVEAIETDGLPIAGPLRIDGGMSANPTFVQLLADAIGRPVAVAPVIEATTLGAAFLAGVAVGEWGSLAEATATAAPRSVVEPLRRLDRERWLDARARALRTVPSLSALEF